ncbi:hypothetical protein PR048_023176 [Dryococelus australis]|uniref:Translation elongation factor EFTs/EF1B dimerisation domain-containing protein n=1 Tax=Dryococelus australis TaxID=614101 RepID=A0ABQ9GTB6_9NEOP|nr:hypothetical protein PR048_023176 [Dryococelus australis]
MQLQMGQDELRGLAGSDGRSLADHLALSIGQLGENLSVRRATCLRAGEGVELVGYTHPAEPAQAGVVRGKYAALVALRETVPQERTLSVQQIGKQLCQHIIGVSVAAC